MTIREYFKKMAEEKGFEVAATAEAELVKMMENEEFEISAWAEEHGVNLEAVGKYGITEFQYWCWENEE